MRKQRVLFVCIHNSARSQMAEAYLNALAGERYLALSAGLEPGRLNPFVVRAMAEDGIDISAKSVDLLSDVLEKEEPFDLVVTVCDQASAERCPFIPGCTARLHWSFPDPSAFTGSDEERLQGTRTVRDAIKKRVAEWIRGAEEK